MNIDFIPPAEVTQMSQFLTLITDPVKTQERLQILIDTVRRQHS